MKCQKYRVPILNYHIGRIESIPLSIEFAFQNLAKFFSFLERDITI